MKSVKNRIFCFMEEIIKEEYSHEIHQNTVFASWKEKVIEKEGHEIHKTHILVHRKKNRRSGSTIDLQKEKSIGRTIRSLKIDKLFLLMSTGKIKKFNGCIKTDGLQKSQRKKDQSIKCTYIVFLRNYLHTKNTKVIRDPLQQKFHLP